MITDVPVPLEHSFAPGTVIEGGDALGGLFGVKMRFKVVGVRFDDAHLEKAELHPLYVLEALDNAAKRKVVTELPKFDFDRPDYTCSMTVDDVERAFHAVETVAAN